MGGFRLNVGWPVLVMIDSENFRKTSEEARDWPLG